MFVIPLVFDQSAVVANVCTEMTSFAASIRGIKTCNYTATVIYVMTVRW